MAPGPLKASGRNSFDVLATGGVNFFTTGGGETVSIANGQLGVGTTSPSQALEVNGAFMMVDGLQGTQSYIGNGGSGNDVEVGSLKSGITAVSMYNHTDNAYMHVYCSSITIEGGSDLAEPFKISGQHDQIPQGAVVVIDEDNPGQLKMSGQAYDTRVAGVVSGAKGVNPGIQMQQQGLLEGGKNVALTGRVYVQADATNGSIKPGDLLHDVHDPWLCHEGDRSRQGPRSGSWQSHDRLEGRAGDDSRAGQPSIGEALMKLNIYSTLIGLVLLAVETGSLSAAERQILSTRVPAEARERALAPMNATNRLQLAIGLPIHNKQGLSNLVRQIYSPSSGQFHHYLTPEQFAAQFSPTEQEYQSVIAYAKANGLETVRRFGNRAVLDVAGTAADIEKMLHVKLGYYRHPTEDRQFYGPDTAPSVEAGLPISYIVGLDNYITPQGRVHQVLPQRATGGGRIDNGSGTNGYYIGYNFRKAYAPGVTNTGTGQAIGLFELVGYTPNDITKYESLAGLPNVPVVPIIMTNASGLPDSSFNHDGEIALDIEMVISMAPGLLEVEVVEGYTGVDAMNEFVSPTQGEPIPGQVSSSWGFSEGVSLETQLLEMQAQGQSFFLASGDSGAPAVAARHLPLTTTTRQWSEEPSCQ